MPTVDKVRVSYGVTRNAGNYESVRYHEEVEASLVGEDKAGETLDGLQDWLKERVNLAADKLVAEHKRR